VVAARRSGAVAPVPPRRLSVALRLTRYGLPGAILLAGVCACVVLLNLLLRLGASGDRDRVREAAARDYYDAHGRWPEDRRPAP
jgi:hypothetical protein